MPTLQQFIDYVYSGTIHYLKRTAPRALTPGSSGDRITPLHTLVRLLTGSQGTIRSPSSAAPPCTA